MKWPLIDGLRGKSGLPALEASSHQLNIKFKIGALFQFSEISSKIFLNIDFKVSN